MSFNIIVFCRFPLDWKEKLLWMADGKCRSKVQFVRWIRYIFSFCRSIVADACFLQFFGGCRSSLDFVQVLMWKVCCVVSAGQPVCDQQSTSAIVFISNNNKIIILQDLLNRIIAFDNYNVQTTHSF
jgi:hypothetical protein